LPAPPIIAPSGELDITSVASFRSAVEEACRDGCDGVVVDLSAVSFIDSSGLGAVIELHQRLRRQQRELCVVAPAHSAATALFARTGFAGHLRTFDSPGAAARALGADRPRPAGAGRSDHRPAGRSAR
jgi:anti-sigma B factor antagonist